MNIFEVYSRDGCDYCKKAIDLLQRECLSYNEYKLDRDFTRDEIKQRFPEAKTYPIIFLDKKFIGGYNDLVELMEKAT